MKAKIVSIGNSKGIRIPKSILEQCNIEDQVELEVGKDRMVIKPVRDKPREGWNEAFRLMHKKKEDILLLNEAINEDMEDWEWK